MVEDDEGVRVLILGNSGMGKTTAARLILAELTRRQLIDFQLVHDDVKRRPQFDGVIFRNVESMVEAAKSGRLPPARASQLLFRGDRQTGLICEVEEVAAKALELGRADYRPVLVIDELDRCMTSGGGRLTSPSTLYALTQGRGLRVSVMALTQNPHRAPNEAIDQATSIVFFQLGPRAANYLGDRLMFDAELVSVVSDPTRLQRGDFVLWCAGRPWDRRIYRFGRGART